MKSIYREEIENLAERVSENANSNRNNWRGKLGLKGDVSVRRILLESKGKEDMRYLIAIKN